MGIVQNKKPRFYYPVQHYSSNKEKRGRERGRGRVSAPKRDGHTNNYEYSKEETEREESRGSRTGEGKMKLRRSRRPSDGRGDEESRRRRIMETGWGVTRWDGEDGRWEFRVSNMGVARRTRKFEPTQGTGHGPGAYERVRPSESSAYSIYMYAGAEGGPDTRRGCRGRR